MYQHYFEVVASKHDAMVECIGLTAASMEDAKATVEAMPSVQEVVEVYQYWLQ